MKTILITITSLLLTANLLFAQHARFISSGSIEFEKSANTFVLMKRMFGNSSIQGLLQQAIEQYQKTQPQFKVLKSTLIFGNNKTLFTPAVSEARPTIFGEIPMVEQKNIV